MTTAELEAKVSAGGAWLKVWSAANPRASAGLVGYVLGALTILIVRWL